MMKKLFLFLLCGAVCLPFVWARIGKRNPLSNRYFYDALYGAHDKDVEWVRQHLKAGYDPNYCRGECGWVDSNPLKVIVDSPIPGTHNKEWNDVQVINMLIDYGADVHRHPYIWYKVYRENDEDIERGRRHIEEERENRRRNGRDDSDVEDFSVELYIESVNSVIKTLLDSGADPNRRGHPYLCGHAGISPDLPRFTDEKAREYCNRPDATTPLYEAIKKGMRWESQVDLLLEYGAVLDDSCLRAAEESGDAAMVEKIRRLYGDGANQ